nr:DUF5133 domain-containing protein [Streptomyces sp. LUP47B]
MTQTRQEIRRQLEDASYTLCVVTSTRQLDTALNVARDRHGARGIYAATLVVQALTTVGFTLRDPSTTGGCGYGKPRPSCLHAGPGLSGRGGGQMLTQIPSSIDRPSRSRPPHTSFASCCS